MPQIVDKVVGCSLLILVYLLAPSAVAADGPVAEWRFVRDQSGASTKAGTPFNPITGSLVATAVGPVQFEERSPHALTLTGDSKAKHRIVVSPEISHDRLPQQNFTLEAWVLIDKPLEWGGIIGCFQDNGSFERGWLLGYRNSQFCFGLSTESQKRLTYLTSKTMFEPGFWYHVTGTYDGKTMTLFVDGKPVASSQDQSGPVAYPEKAPMVIGAYEDDNELHALAGRIEQVSIWDRSLKPDEIVSRFQRRKTQFPEIDAVRPNVVDWPTYNRDNQRTGVAGDPLKFPLHLQWVHRHTYTPRPAWPKPANQDFWHKKFKLKPRVVYDRANHVVTVGDRVYFGSSADCRVHCLDTDNGETVWTFATEGPVRLAPTIVGNRVVFGSDDGRVYCVSAADGKLLWKIRGVDQDRRIPGNERVISVWPVRTGVLVEDNIGYFCAGLFPQQGVYQTAVDIRTGKKLASNKVDMSAQGYLERKAGRLFVATGRDPAGAFVAGLKRRGKGVGREVASIPEEFRYAFVGADETRIGGGDGVVAAFDEANGKRIWSADVDGKAWSLAIARGKLFVSTHRGAVYCFGSEVRSKPIKGDVPGFGAFGSWGIDSTIAKRIFDASGTDRGYCLITDCQSAHLSIELARRSELKIVARCDADHAGQVRAAIEQHSKGPFGFGHRITVHVADEPGESLPYTDYMFNLVVSDRIHRTGKKPDICQNPELRRIVRPLGGVIISDLTPTGIYRRGKLKGSGDWTHMYANPGNTVCSLDTHVTGPMDIQWFGRPGPQQMIDRHHRTVAPVWANGRLFIPGDNRVIGADAYNGTQLWNVPVLNSRRAGAYRDSSYLVAGDDSVFVAAGGECRVLDAQTGQSKMTLKPADRVDEEQREWGFLSVDAGQVFGSTTKPGGIRRGHSLVAINEGTFWDFRPLVCSDSFFAIDQKTGENSWQYQATSGMLINSSFTIGKKHVYFVESTNSKTNDVANGRIDPRELMGKGSRVVALHRDSGSIAWTKDLDLTSIQHNVHCAFHAGKLVVVGSYNSGTDKKKDSVLYDVNVLDAESGDVVWKKTQRQGITIGGDHGEQDHHPVIVHDRLYCEPFAYNLHSGEALTSFSNWDKKHRRGCGTISASASSFFFRQSNPTMFDLKTNKYEKVTTATRPGCWINMIPAGGLLLIPEASSGCTCNYAVQTSLAFLPRKPVKSRSANEE